MAITREWNLAFQLQLGYIAVIHVSNDYSFYLHWIASLPMDALPVSVIDSYWSSPFRDALLSWIDSVALYKDPPDSYKK